jgi:hypothetical protein
MGASLMAASLMAASLMAASLMAASLMAASLMAASLMAASLMAALITTTTMGHGTSLLMMMHFFPIVSGVRGKRSGTVASPGAATHAANPASICVSKMGIGWICAACNVGLQNLVAGMAQR